MLHRNRKITKNKSVRKASNLTKIDPTQTTSLRRAMEKHIDKKFANIKASVRKYLKDNKFDKPKSKVTNKLRYVTINSSYILCEEYANGPAYWLDQKTGTQYNATINTYSPPIASSTVGIIGGGPGGLLTAYLLTKDIPNLQVTIYEASDRCGGKVRTQSFPSEPALTFEGGVAELYGSPKGKPDALRDIIEELGLQMFPIKGEAVVLGDKIIESEDHLSRHYGPEAQDSLSKLYGLSHKAITPDEYHDKNYQVDKNHLMVGKTYAEILELLHEDTKKYVESYTHSDVAVDPQRTTAMYGIINLLTNDPNYLNLYTLRGGIEELTKALHDVLKRSPQVTFKMETKVELVSRAMGGYRINTQSSEGKYDTKIFERVVCCLPAGWIPSVDWGSNLQEKVRDYLKPYDNLGNYLRVTLLFDRAFWQPEIKGHWWMSDAFNGCCVYSESDRLPGCSVGILGWLIAGDAAQVMVNYDKDRLAQECINSLPSKWRKDAQLLYRDIRVNRFIGEVSGLPGTAEPINRPDLWCSNRDRDLMFVGDYQYDGTLNGLCESAYDCLNYIKKSITANKSLVKNPFVSEDQRRACYAKDDPNWDCKEWDVASNEFDPDQPRDDKGMWSQDAGGAGGAIGTEKRKSLIDKARDKIVQAYTKFKDRYGKAGAIAMLGAMAVTLPIPGNILGVIGAAEAIRAGAKLLSHNEEYDIEAMVADMYDLASSLGVEKEDLASLKEDLYKSLTTRLQNPTANYEFKTDDDQIDKFKTWLKDQFDNELTGLSEEDVWEKYLNSGVEKGVGRAFDAMKKADQAEAFSESALGDTGKLDFYEGSKLDFLESSFDQPIAKEKMEALASRTFDDLEDVTEDMVDKLSETLLDGLNEGKNPLEIADELEENLGIGANSAKRIARTEIIRAHAEGTLMGLKKLGVAKVGVEVEFSATGGDEGFSFGVCEECMSLQGEVYPIDEASGIIPVHPNCVLPGNYIQGNIVSALKASYSGQAVEIVTKNGTRVTLTINHPIFTKNGLVDAGQLNKGDHLISHVWQPEVEPRSNIQNSPMLIEEVFKSFSSMGNNKTIGSFDLNGDELFIEGKIEVVSPNLLLRKCKSCERQSINEVSLVTSNYGSMRSANLFHSLLSTHHTPLNSLSFALGSDMNIGTHKSGSNKPSTNSKLISDRLLGVTSGVQTTNLGYINGSPIKYISFGGASSLDTMFSKPTDKGIAFNTNFISQLFGRFPSEITFDEVIEVRRFHYAGPVYDLETVPGYFTISQGGSASLLIRNCRCAWLPHLPDDEDEPDDTEDDTEENVDDEAIDEEGGMPMKGGKSIKNSLRNQTKGLRLLRNKSKAIFNKIAEFKAINLLRRKNIKP